MISGNVPQHLVVAARTGFLTAIGRSTDLPYNRIASTINMGAKSIDLADLGAAPMPVRNRGKGALQDFIEKALTITPVDWDITVGISYNAVNDDQTGTLERKVRSAGNNFNRHINNLAFDVLEKGDATTTYGAGYDGLALFADAHIDKGAHYQTGQDNNYGLALSLDNFTTVMVAARNFLDDQGEPCDYNFDTLTVPPTLEYLAANICNNPQAMDTASRELNAYSGKVTPLVTPKFNTTAWVLSASGESTKPVIVAMREQPNLQSAWFDPEQAEGGMYYFKFFGRYNAFPGDWRTAILGNT